MRSTLATFGVVVALVSVARGGAPVIGRVTPPMAHARVDHVATALADGRAVVTGGFVDDGVEWSTPTTVEVFDPKTGAWTLAQPMVHGRRNHTATRLLDERVLVIGGSELHAVGDRGSWSMSP